LGLRACRYSPEKAPGHRRGQRDEKQHGQDPVERPRDSDEMIELLRRGSALKRYLAKGLVRLSTHGQDSRVFAASGCPECASWIRQIARPRRRRRMLQERCTGCLAPYWRRAARWRRPGPRGARGRWRHRVPSPITNIVLKWLVTPAGRLHALFLAESP